MIDAKNLTYRLKKFQKGKIITPENIKMTYVQLKLS